MKLKSDSVKPWKSMFKAAMVSTAVAWMCCIPFHAALAQTPGASDLSPDLQEVVTLSQQHMNDDVITSFIKNSGKAYKLSANDIIYLSNQGVSQNVILALEQTVGTATIPAAPAAPVTPVAPAPEPPPAPTPQPAPEAPIGDGAAAQSPEVNFQYFHDQLAPWGSWMEVPGLGMVWRPSMAITGASPDWRPYYDNGQWVETDNGLYWQSDYVWGDIPFHYGRWVMNPVYGWLWVPDYTWGPAWVFWRHAEDEGVVGWAPLPPGAIFVDGGFLFHGVRVGLDFDFGLGETAFVFVDGAHFHERIFRLRGREWAYHIGWDQRHDFFRHSVVRNEFRRDEHGRFVNEGIGHDRMAHLDAHIEQAHFEERHPTGDREKSPTGGDHGTVAGLGHSTSTTGGSPGKVFRPPTSSSPQPKKN